MIKTYRIISKLIHNQQTEPQRIRQTKYQIAHKLTRVMLTFVEKYTSPILPIMTHRYKSAAYHGLFCLTSLSKAERNIVEMLAKAVRRTKIKFLQKKTPTMKYWTYIQRERIMGVLSLQLSVYVADPAVNSRTAELPTLRWFHQINLNILYIYCQSGVTY